ncbi:MAG: hypothetical protein ABEI52_01950, partial [Halobacteriaceae archaeon]
EITTGEQTEAESTEHKKGDSGPTASSESPEEAEEEEEKEEAPEESQPPEEESYFDDPFDSVGSESENEEGE